MTAEASSRASREIDLKTGLPFVVEILDLVEECGNFLNLIHNDVANPRRQGSGLAPEPGRVSFKTAPLIRSPEIVEDGSLRRHNPPEEFRLPGLAGAKEKPNLVPRNSG